MKIKYAIIAIENASQVTHGTDGNYIEASGKKIHRSNW